MLASRAPYPRGRPNGSSPSTFGGRSRCNKTDLRSHGLPRRRAPGFEKHELRRPRAEEAAPREEGGRPPKAVARNNRNTGSEAEAVQAPENACGSDRNPTTGSLGTPAA